MARKRTAAPPVMGEGVLSGGMPAPGASPTGIPTPGVIPGKGVKASSGTAKGKRALGSKPRPSHKKKV